VKLIKRLLILLLFVTSPLTAQKPTSPLPQDEISMQRFVCNTGYTRERCNKDVAVLRLALAKYPPAQLGTWTWILVLSNDWKLILESRGLDSDSPAFTYYPKRETFIEEALVTEVPVRSRELLLKWNMNRRNLLELAITHELAHAFCSDPDESNANQLGQLLREGKTASCRGGPSNTHANIKH
jgi:hypothetical protein